MYFFTGFIKCIWGRLHLIRKTLVVFGGDRLRSRAENVTLIVPAYNVFLTVNHWKGFKEFLKWNFATPLIHIRGSTEPNRSEETARNELTSVFRFFFSYINYLIIIIQLLVKWIAIIILNNLRLPEMCGKLEKIYSPSRSMLFGLLLPDRRWKFWIWLKSNPGTQCIVKSVFVTRE